MAGQPLNATFFAFQKREKGGVLLGASAAYLAVAIVFIAAFIALNYQAFGAIASWYGSLISASVEGKQPSASAVAALPAGFGMFIATLFPFMFFFYVLLAAYEAACLRWMIRGETGGLFGLTLGADTWRVYLSYWVWFLLYMALSIVFGILTLLVVGVGAVSMQGSTESTAVAGSAIAVIAITLLRLLVMLFFAVRLAPAAATSVGRKRFSFFQAWVVTRGRFWSLLASFFIVILIALVGEIVFAGVVFSIIGFSAFQAMATLGPNADSTQMSAALSTMFTPQHLIVLGVAYAILLALSLFIYVLFFGINARAVQAAIEEGKIQVAA